MLGYLYGPGRANEHTDPHLVASWDGFAPDPGRSADFTATKKQLVNALNLRVHQAGDRAPDQHVWHCSIRAAPEDRILSDEDWADIARRIVHATGIAPNGDPGECRWAAVRHADDHIHIAATTVRGDLRPARHWNDYLTADRELAAVEADYGLRRVARGDRTAAKRPTRAEKEKSLRSGHQLTARERLRTIVRTALSAATSTEKFIGILTDTDGILIEIQHFPSGDIRGYKVALDGDTNAAGQPIWFSGSKLAPDLSLPKIHERLAAGNDTSTNDHRGRSNRNPWHDATAATEEIPERLDQGDDAAAQAHLAALGEALDALPLVAPTPLRAQLRQAAAAFERATRSRIRSEHHHARALRSAMRAVLRDPAPAGDGTGLAMLLDAAVLAVIAATRWHQLRQHDQQVTAARRAVVHLQAAYDRAAPVQLEALVKRKPPARAVRQHIRQIHACLPDYAERILGDPAWEALAAALTNAEMSGHDPERLIQQAADQRALSDARSPAQVLTWRVHRLALSPMPSARPVAAAAQQSPLRDRTATTRRRR
nr:mobilization protein [Streptomyces sp. HNM0575]